MRRLDRPSRTHPHGAWVGLLAVLMLAALPLLAANALGAPTAQVPQHAIYLPLIMGPPYYRIAFVSQRDGNEEIYVMNADGSHPTNLSHNPARDVAPAWSPDGRQIAFERDGNIDVMNADGANQTNLQGGREPAWSPDGSCIAYADGDIYTMRADGSDVVAITKSEASQNMNPAWSPDGMLIAFVYGDELYRYGYDICLKKTNGVTTMRDLSKTLSDGDEYSPAWSPDGRWIAFSSSYPFYENSIYIVHPDGANLTRLTAGHGPPAWSPDGRRLAFEQGGDIHVINADGSGLINLSKNPATDTNPVWSPDARQIAFVSQRDGNAEIYVMNADGSNPTRLTNNLVTDWGPVWSPTIN